MSWVGSKYFDDLQPNDKKAYKEKLTLANGAILQDPFTISEKDWLQDEKLLPNIKFEDIYKYLMETPGLISQENVKAQKSLESYNFFISGHVQDIFIFEECKSSNFCYLQSQVNLCIILNKL